LGRNRTIHRSDFHLPPDADPDDQSARELFVDVVIGFPELAAGTATPETVAPAFRHMRIERPGADPVCRFRLEARWEDDGTVEGEVAQELFWVDTLDATVVDDQKHTVSASDRGLIQIFYTPASRDAEAQIRATTGALAARLLRAIEWSTDTQEAVEEASEELGNAFEAEDAIEAIGEALARRWSDLHDEVVDTKPRLSLVSRRFEEVVSRVNVIFQQGPAGIERGLDVLSDGQQSLFYFALAAAVFDLERSVVAGVVDGFRSDELFIPALTIFALEEPESHLSPYYLARIVRQVRSLVSDGGAQAIVTSHSPAVLSRVQPEEVRYCRCDPDTRASSVRAVRLPVGDEEAVKFVRGTMLAFPELYFARFVLLVERDSERIVLPSLAEALDLLVDPAFVAIVPLGGRHVQHFWRLLTHLGIPHATLLDLDLGREGGGYGRVKTAIECLIEVGVSREKLLETNDGILSAERFAKMHTWNVTLKTLNGWAESLSEYGVFFSSPLDLDMAMLAAFPDAYVATIPAGGGSKLTIEKAAEAVLGTGGLGLEIYTDELEPFRKHMPAYRYHFLTHSKPAAHLRALAKLSREALRKDMPKELATVLTHIQENTRRD
jgi:putative ATP-dependent endonuclease of OLD family